MTWLARHEEDTHFADLQALLLRLHISFDGVAPLMRLRLDPLVHSVRSLVLDAVVTMDSASLLPCLEWLRELTPPSSLAPMVVIPPKSAVAAAWSKSPLSREKLHFEATYFDAPSISRHRLEFCPPQHVKHFSLPKVNERHVCDMSLDPTWVSPVDLTGVLN
ncbi:hypothetical protein DYB38_014123 [Aphanomyces astaci]|uniref:Uncharacterized protein n=1 Tax=Aphanomyces astaci TaxID=112090 RepID=A0A397CDI8_APHAT|nr:hypothetical protein DYB38_014123 [Aphanomyces astaci]